MPIRIAENRSLSLSASRTIDADHRHVVVFDAAAQRVRHQLLGDHADELRRIAQQRLPQLDRAVDLLCRPTASTDGIDRHAAVAALLGPPLAVGVEVLEREPDRVHQLVAAGARLVLAVQRHLLAQRHDLVVAAVESSSGGTFGGGSGGGVPRMFSSTQTPRFTGDVRKFCVQVSASKLPLPEQPAAVVEFRPERHAAELRPVDVRDAVMLAPAAR